MSKLLRKRDVIALTSLSAPTIWRLERAGKFPRAIRISAGRIAWREEDVMAWLADRAASSDKAQ